MRLLILLITINLSSSARQNTIFAADCDNSTSSHICQLSNRFYDIDVWQIERNRAVTHLKITNLQSETLPTAVAESFPNLISYSAIKTSVRTVRKENFRSMRKLEELELKNGELLRIKRDSFDDLENLVQLDLGGNFLKLISPEFFRRMDRLEVLLINSNDIEEVNPRILRNLLNLKNFDMSDNKIYSISGDVFSNNKRLRKISMNNNSLKFIESSTFNGLEELKVVELNNNDCIDKVYSTSSTVKSFLGAIKKDVSENCQNGTKM